MSVQQTILIEETREGWRCAGALYPSPIVALSQGAFRLARTVSPGTTAVRWRTVSPEGYDAVSRIAPSNHIDQEPHNGSS